MTEKFTVLELAEGAFDDFDRRILEGTYAFADRKLYRNHPYLGFVLEGTDGGYVPDALLTLNSVGLRAPEDFDENCYRICVLGGSVAFGSYSPRNNATIPAFLETLVNESLSNSGRRVQVINCGQGGHILAQHMILLHHIVLSKYKPNMVICFSGYNDYSVFRERMLPGSSLQQEFPNIIKFMQTGTFSELLRHVFLKTLRVRYRAISVLYDKTVNVRSRFLRSRGDAVTGEQSSSTKLDVGSHIEYYTDTTLQMRAMLNGLKVKFMSAIQPALEYGQKPLTAEESYILARRHAGKIKINQELKAFYDALRDGLHSVEVPDDFSVVDCTPVFDNVSRQIYIDPAHMGDAGNRRIAEYLRPHVLKLMGEHKY